MATQSMAASDASRGLCVVLKQASIVYHWKVFACPFMYYIDEFMRRVLEKRAIWKRGHEVPPCVYMTMGWQEIKRIPVYHVGG